MARPFILIFISAGILLLGCQSQSDCANVTCSGDSEYISDDGTCTYCQECSCVGNRRTRCFCECLSQDSCDDDTDVDSISDTAAVIGIVSVAVALLCIICLCCGSVTYWKHRKTSYYSLNSSPIAREHVDWEANLPYIPPQENISAVPPKQARPDQSKLGSVKPAFAKQIQQQFQQQQPAPSAPPDDESVEPSAPPLDGGAVTGQSSIYE